MSIDTEHQNPTQTTATAATSDPKGKSKQKEVDPSVHEDMSDSGESGVDTQDEYPFERFPSPPGDKPRNAHVPNATASLDPPLMAFTYPPPSPLAHDPSWYAQMVADVHRNRAHVNNELELARTEAAEALADVTLAEIELKAERDRMQDFLNRLGSVAGKNFVRKMIKKVERSLKTRDKNLDDQYEEELQESDDEDEDGSDEGEHQDTEEEDLGGGAGESEDAPQDAEDDEYGRSGDDGSRERSESPPASCSPSSTDCPQQYLYKSVSDGEANSRESSKPQPADESPSSSSQGISHQISSPNWRRGDVTDDEYSSGEDNTSRKWTDLSPGHMCRKRNLEVEEEEANGPEDSPRKKFKESHPSTLEDVKLFPLPTRCFYPPENNKDNTIDQDHDSDDEYEVENSLTLEHEPVQQRPYLPQLNRLERDPFRVRQNSQGEPELYVPGRRAIELP
ncbi:uncharacterized protein BJ212DRAFT_1475995 [Suillus subaureus]|uniref:Uncharacterized protein n=1 Tax=Suillus subaureus TaxID=48587 RepID=A0A9P7ELH7_9AGAM|nr:uncharacterized protein BJ212DRAFT_1475995 [Suillus subaureus]KAG1824702.1 hypothetical protein BJ212DRAFT_1475995 [Suillus subaureus]